VRGLRESRGANPVPMNRWSRKTVLIAGKSSREAFNFTTRPSAPTFIASCKISGPWCEVKNRILERGAALRICRAASTPLSFGSPMSSKTRSGCNSSLFWTASKPSEHSPIITRSSVFCRSERTARRHARESSTIKIRLRRLEVESNLNGASRRDSGKATSSDHLSTLSIRTEHTVRWRNISNIESIRQATQSGAPLFRPRGNPAPLSAGIPSSSRRRA
jgi:hypothetical protein